MTRRRILEALWNGEVGLAEARRALLINGSGNGGVDSVASLHPKPPAPTRVTDADALDRLQAELVKSLAAALYMNESDIQLDLNFTDMGLDSIVGVEWINQIKKQYGIKVPATKVYDYPTIQKFADYLHGVIQEAGRSPAATRVTQVGVPESPAPLPQVDSRPRRSPQPASPPGSIAIVGMSGRYPGAPDLSRFWENLVHGKNSIREIPRERWDLNDYYDPDPSKPGKTCCKWLGALEAIDRFDAPFFMISPVEAEVMDPQYRIFIEEAYQAFEDAGYSGQSLSNQKCGVYMGVMNSEYVHLLAKHQAQGLNIGNSHSIAAARISYFLNLKGPAIPIDTACSSSLVATHLACQALRNGEIEMALVGGVTLYLTPGSFIGMSAAGMLSPDGQCRSFDNGANGFVPGEGAGTLVLKRLEDAERDHDCIHGVILGSGINQDGRTNGITAPSVQSQIELERDVYRRFGINPETIDYVEAHGTGTSLGDPIELEALTTVFREHTARRNFCGLGSVKSNIGHTSAAAGMAGMHKMLLCFKNQTLVPSLNFEEANRQCDFEDSPFYVNTETKPWRARADAPRRAAVSSMGFSGTNAHIVIEEYGGPMESREQEERRRPYFIVLSARNEARLTQSARNLQAFLKSGVRLPPLRDLAYTLQIGRDAMEERLGLLVDSLDDLVIKLGWFLEGRNGPDSYRGRVQRLKGKLSLYEPDEAMAKIIAAWLDHGHWGKLLDRWVGGLVFDWTQLYGDDRPYRVSLPTYPFARERYWVNMGNSAGEIPGADVPIRSVSTAEPHPAPAPHGLSKPSGLSLNDPGKIGNSFSSPAPSFRSPEPLTLRPILSGPAQAAAVSELDLLDHGDGILAIRVSHSAGRNGLSEEMVSSLVRNFQRIRARADAKVLLLTGDEQFFLSGEAGEGDELFDQKIARLPLDCEIPVIAVLKGRSTGMGWLMASLCDFMVCSEESHYGYDEAGAPQGSREAREFMVARFGRLGEDLISAGRTFTGRELKERGGAFPVVPQHEVEGCAMRLAREISQAPRESLVHLKRHLSRDLAPLLDRSDRPLLPISGLELRASEEAEANRLELRAAAAPDPGGPESVEKFSDVVKFDIYQNGVVLLTLCDIQSKNTFSEALARGVADSFERIRRTPGYKVVVLTGFGNHFACGGTREALLAIQEGSAKFTDSKISGLPLECEIPVIAAMQGHGIGAGWSMGMFCDHVFFSEESTYHSPYLRYGFTPGAGSTLIFPERLGHDLGWEILFTAREYKGHELRSRGMKMPVLPRSEVVSRALQMAHRLALSSRESLVRLKAARSGHLRANLESIYAQEVALHEKTFVGSQEVRARIERYFSQGPPVPGERTEPDIRADEPRPSAWDLAILKSITNTLRETLAGELHAKPEAIDVEIPFIEMGLDSVNNVTWVRELNRRYGLSIGATDVYSHPTVSAFADHILKQGKLRGLFLRDQGADSAAPAMAVNQPEVSALKPGQSHEEVRRAKEGEKKRPPSRRVLKPRDVLNDLKSAVGGGGKMLPTLNRTGVVLETLTPSSLAFAKYAGQCQGEVLDIGCAYGAATIAALEAGASVLAVDMEPQHLEILEARIEDEARSRLRTHRAVLPEVDFEKGRFAAIHAARVIHFLRPEAARITIRKMFDWLQPGGCLFLISDTPYVGYWKSKADEYEARKAQGDLWPGYMEDVGKQFNRREIEGAPPLINALDPDILRRECEAAGFQVEKVGFEGGIDPGLEPSQPGREHAAVIARKPAEMAAGAERLSTADAEETTERLQQDLKQSLAEALHARIEAIDEEMPFIELGVDSVISLTWVRGINTRYGLSIGASRIYDYPSLREFSRFLKTELNKLGQAEVPVVVPLCESRGGETHLAVAPKRARDARVLQRPYGLVLSKGHAFAELELRQWNMPAPAATEVIIQVKASAISFTDVICVKGLYPAAYPFVPGLEVSGVVSSVGPGVRGIRAGDEVIALTGGRMGGHAEYVNVPESHLVAKPRSLSFEEACSLPLAFGAIYYALETLGRLAPLEHLLIQTATGGCGLMALQLARLKASVCYGSSSREEKRDLLKRLGVPHVLDYKSAGFEQELRKLSGGRGVDVVLNTLSGGAIQQGLNCLAPSGRYLELATHALMTSPKLDLSNLRFNQSIQVVAFLEMLSRPDGNAVRELLERMTVWAESGKIVPTVSRVYPLHRIAEALEYVSDGRHIGKVVISHTAEVMEDCLDACIARLDAQKRLAEAHAPPRPERAFVMVSGPAPVPGKGLVERVAIIGMSGRFPKSRTLADFWENLAAGRDCISEIPPSRWSIEHFYDPDPASPGKTCCKWMGVLEEIDRFDPLFFRISPAEARLMDPQQRLFIESCWSCLEDAGINPKSLSGANCAVIAGCGIGDYGLNAERGGVIGTTGVAPSILPARISYLLNLKGPCLAIDTSCSSSLVAIASACDSLILGNCDLALAGGVLVMTGPSLHVGMSQGGMLSPDGRCFTFDERANGFVPGEGVGVVLLKRLSEAVRDGDNIHGIIQGWGVNQDGKTNGITAPSMTSQMALERDLYARFGLDPETISLAEAHGTGTRLGDPIEVEALTAAFRAYTRKRAYCALGSVKSNIGHLGVAAGIAGVLKILLAIGHRTIPPTIQFEKLNPQIPLEGSPFYISEEARPWDSAAGRPRRACVSSFGFSGTNAHLVIEEPTSSPRESAPPANPTPAIVVLSAKTEDALRQMAQNLLEFLSREPSSPKCGVHDIAYTLQVGREAMGERLGLIVESREGLQKSLKDFLEGRKVEDLHRDQVKRNQEVIAAFRAGDKSRGTLEQWIQTKDYSEILGLWVKGLDFDWNRLYPQQKPRRVSLPGYPFARERYWLDKPATADRPPEKAEEKAADGADIFMAQPVWKELEEPEASLVPKYERHLVFLSRSGLAALEEIQRQLPDAVCIPFKSEKEDPGERFIENALQVFETLKGILGQKSAGKSLVQAFLPSDGDGPLMSGLSGLFKTAHLENPKLIAQVIEADTDNGVSETLLQAASKPDSEHLRYTKWRWAIPALEISLSGSRTNVLWKDQGVYLISGGAGGLGLIFAREIAAKAAGPTIILVGRSELDSQRKAALTKLESLGAKVVYRQVDMADLSAVRHLVKGIQEEHGVLHGVIHAAGLIRDNFIIKKGGPEFRAVLAPKVLGATNLDHATKDLPLDFFVLFSSGAGATGNAGQADYAAANAFLNAFAGYRSGLVSRKQRWGKTISIQWPLWKNGGMRVDQTTQQVIRDETGMAAMETASGIRAFYRAMTAGSPQVMVVSGDVSRIREAMLRASSTRASNAASASPPAPVEKKKLREQTLHKLKRLLGEVIDLPPERLESDEPLESYGIDSVMVTRLNQQIGRVYPEASQTLFFEFQTLGDIATYFVEAFPHETTRWTGLDQEETATIEAPVSGPLPSREIQPLRTPHSPVKTRSLTAFDGSRPAVQEPIAIIGICGRYAQADTLEAFWDNLKSGKDCVTEIPPERWALEGFFHDDPEEAIKQGKSYSKWGSFLEGFAEFDPLFFNISPLEALGMDPQERLFLQASWEVLETAGYTRARLAETIDGDVGVFAGVTKTGFDQYRSDWRKQGEVVSPYTSFGSVANRVSYLLNLKGPSMPIDTMCSSSLTAIHEACDQLRRGSCQMAIAGGVNLYLHPSSYVGLCAQRMLSKDGKCKSFGEGGNGFVPGEGVGVVLLKPLAIALEDGDPIQAIIRGSSVNHGGKTNGYTVPNPNAQREVIRTALDKAGVEARTVSYLEAHGTGTELGDPIEVTGLTQAFAQDTPATGFCALGSAKSNLGHLEAAAGIAGLSKVVLQMRHGKLAPSLHARALNPRINFSKTPFVVQQELADWNRPTLSHDGQTVEYPRIAGISSFGAGGANAHVVIEEPPLRSSSPSGRGGPALVVLSAKTEERLQAYAKKLSDFLSDDSATIGLDLHDLAFTLQVGREAMEQRSAFIVKSLPELREKVAAFLKDPNRVESCFRGRVQRNTESLSEFYGDEDMAQTIAAWLRKSKLDRIAELWVRGGSLDWEKLYGESIPRMIPLPTYPFARERYWVEIKPAPAVEQGCLHPMVHANTSDLAGLRFTSIFSGEEFFVADHVVDGKKVLPGVAYLEMARFAARQVARASSGRSVGAIIRNLVWARPISVEGPGKAVHIRLFDSGEDGISFSIEAGEEGEEPLVRSQGFVLEGRGGEAPVLDLQRLRAEIAGQLMDGRQCYAAFTSMGVDYGPRYQGIQELSAGAGQALARLALPAPMIATAHDYVLHPSLLDSALQACIGLSLLDRGDPQENAPTFVPYALDELEIFGPCVNLMWAWIRPARAELPEAGATKLDIDLCADHGQVRVSLRGLSFRRFEGGADQSGKGATLMMSPAWTTPKVPTDGSPAEYSGRLVLVCGIDAPSPEALELFWPGAACLPLPLEGKALEQRFEEASIHAFGIIRELLGTPAAKGKQLVQIVIPSDPEGLLLGGLSGLLKTARLENPEFVGQVIAIDPSESEEGLLRKLGENSGCPEDIQIRYEGGVREVVSWREEPAAFGAATAPWKDGGVYLITGGAGGLGMIFAEAIARQTRGAHLILCGRSDLSPEKQERLSAIEKTGAKIVYRRADISRLRDVEQLIAGLQKEYGTLHGILHGAGVTWDHLMINKSAGEFRDVLAPKVAGTVYLDQVTKGLDLDFFVLFSAGAAVLGNPGQADYATANAFLDEFARYRNKLVATRLRRGVTLSVNWPLWAAGGMTMDETAVAAMKEKLGMTPMEAGDGIDAFLRALASGKDQVLVVHGDPRRLRSLFSREPAKRPAVVDRSHQDGTSISPDSLEEKTVEYFRELLSSTLRAPLNRIHPDGLMSDLGIDSVVVMNLTNRLEESFGSLSKTLFFEHQTLRALARYFIESHSGKLRLLFQPEEGRVNVEEPVSAPEALPARARPQKPLPPRPVLSSITPAEPRSTGALDIAIIGLSGRYPKARNIRAYWEVLREGRDCITEVPRERWDWRDYYSEDPAEGKGHSSKWGGFIDDVDQFDPQFFNISPRIAPYLDPQERLILEETWKALEDAGYRREDLQKQAGDETWSPVGVYIGAMYGEYQLFGAEASLSGQRLGFAGNLASIANRVSYLLNLHGPSMMVDTMCSSSLTCIHLACQDLAAGRTNYGIAGGVNVTIHPNKYLMLSGGQFLSPAGRCESFGEGGAGYIPSEGVGVVLLKRLADAERDGDQIYGVIKGSAVNHGGRTHGYSVPNPKAQERVIAQALREARIDPRTVSYLEAHGTGTRLGDPIEIAALARAFGRQPGGHRCWIGSAKSNLGHCESAAGIAGLTKVLLQMKHRQIAPSLHSRVLNPHIDFESTPFVVNQTLRDWERPLIDGKPGPRIAGVSSFGAGGSNAHILVEEHREKRHAGPSEHGGDGLVGPGEKRRAALIVISAKNEERLTEVARNLSHHLKTSEDTSPELLRNLAYTLQVGREPMEERLAFAVSLIQELQDKLDQFLHRPGEVAGLLRGRVNDAPRNAGSFSVDQAAREAVDEWLEQGNDAKLLERWVSGLEIDWKRLYRDPKPRRISLPAYPFLRKRFWVELGQESTPPEPTIPPPPGSESRARPLSLKTEGSGAWGPVPAEKPRAVALNPLPPEPSSSRGSRGNETLTNLDNRSGEPASTPPKNVTVSLRRLPQVADFEQPANRPQSSVSQKALQDELLSSLAKALLMEENEISLDKPFLDLGLDSIVGVEWVNAINKKYGLAIPANQVYEYPSLRQFTEFFHRQLQPSQASPRDAEANPVRPAPKPPRPAPARAESPSPAPSETPPKRAAIAHSGRRAAEAKATDIAIVGISGQFPGGQTLDEFWRLLQTGQSAFTDFPRDRDWDLTKLFQENSPSHNVALIKGGFLKGVDCFDPLFFQISPKEAMTMDPGERIFLQESWKALEDAGIVPAALSGRRWGVFCGNGGDYTLRIRDLIGYSPHVTLAQVPSRVSHCLNLTGPSQSIDAGCASALLAIAQACDHLVMGKCEAALAGGVLVHSTPNLIISASQVELLARNATGGRALNRSASGMTPGEAAGVVVLKPLADALSAGDRIYGVIEGWGNNHNGKTNGMVSPSIDAEEALFSEVYDRYQIDPDGITFVEANAAGLPLADAAEVQALTRAFRKKSARRQFCALGSVENNVGHAFHASGMSHLMKVLLSLWHRQIPATTNAQSPDPALDLEQSPFFINAETIPWEIENGQRRRAAVSSFGATGANVHLVIAEAPTPDAERSAPGRAVSGPVLIPLSSKTASGLKQRCRDLETWLQNSSAENITLRRLSANLLLRRTHFEHRCALIVDDLATLKRRLLEIVEGKAPEDGFVGSVSASGRLGPALSRLAETKIKALLAGSKEAQADLLVLADLFVQGVTLEMAAGFSQAERAPLSLPPYPFEKRRCWIDAPPKTPSPRDEGGKAASTLADESPNESPETLEILIGFLAELTGLSREELDPDSRLSEYGIDSLLGMRLLNRVNARFGGGFDASLLVLNTIGGLAAEIARQGTARTDHDVKASSPNGRWVRPAFIESLVMEVATDSDLPESQTGQEQLARLIKHGVGVWKEAGTLCFEFLEKTQTPHSLERLVDHPAALYAALDVGKRYFPPSDMQKFALHESEINKRATFNLCQGFWIDLPVNLEALNAAYNDLVRRHSIFRTGARLVGEQWTQVIHDDLPIACRVVEWMQIDSQERFVAELANFQKERNVELFNLGRAPLLDVYFIHNGKTLGAVYFSTHHFHADGFTLYLFQQELHRRYTAFLQNQPYESPRTLAEYAHFALSQFAPERGAVAQYWLDQLRGKRGHLVLKDQPQYLEEAGAKAGMIELEISPAMLEQLQEFNRRNQTTLTQLVTGALAPLLYRLTKSSHPIQMVYNLRDRFEFESLLGDFSSSVPVILAIDEQSTWQAVLRSYETAALEIQRHKHFDFSVLLKESDGRGGSGLFGDVALDSNDRDAFGDVTEFAGRLIDLTMEERRPVAPLLVCVVKTGGRMTLPFIYDQSRFSRRTIELFADNLLSILGEMLRDVGMPISDLEIFPELAERLGLGGGADPRND